MTTGATDADLVHAHLAGDRAALAAIYDRYAASLYDTAAALLRDPHEAADAVQDTFVAASQHLGQLRDPTRLRAWLFAITRHEVERRGRRRQRTVPTAEVGDVPALSQPDPGAELERSELAGLVRAAAAGLDERDQLVLELSARQGLEGADLAAALGVTAAQSYSLVFRMRERVSRSLGALVVARTGRRDCPELAGILTGWDGQFSVLIRKRVARHVEDCEICERTKARAGLPGLLSVAPAFALPVALRERVLGAVESAGPVSMAVDGDGFPKAGAGAARAAASRRSRTTWLVAAAIVAVGALVAGGIVALAGGNDPTQVEVVGSAALPVAAPTSDSAAPSTDAPASTAPVSTAVTVPATTTTTVATTPPTAPPTPPPPEPGRLVVGAGTLDLGSTAPSASIAISNAGGSPLTWSVADPAGPVSAGGGGTLAAGEQVELVVAVDRAAAPEGPVQASLVVTSDRGEAVVDVTASIERAPAIGGVSFADPAVRAGGCAPRATTVSVAASDESALTLTLTVTGPGGRSTSSTMASTGAGRWSGPVGPFALPGQAQVDVTATDARGNQAGASRSLPVQPCL